MVATLWMCSLTALHCKTGVFFRYNIYKRSHLTELQRYVGALLRHSVSCITACMSLFGDYYLEIKKRERERERGRERERVREKRGQREGG